MNQAMLLFLFSVVAVPGAAPNWPTPTAVGRLKLERAPGSSWPAPAASVEIWPGPPEATCLSVLTAEGQPVNSTTYWGVRGGPAKLLFNTSSGQTVYYLYFDTVPPPALPPWRPEAGLMLETRSSRNLPVNTEPQMRALLASATGIYGRGYVPNIFLGLNPFGPSSYYVAFYNGFFGAPRAGEYGFATISTDASYLSVDGRVVTEWLGRHGPDGGRHGEHSGKIMLGAGRHRLEYVQAQLDGLPCAEAAWRPPGQARFEVMPAGAFEPVATFRTTAFETAANTPPALYWEWAIAGHSLAEGPGVYQVRFRALTGGTNCRWRFEDGNDSGASVQHFFFRAGRHTVEVEAHQGERRLAEAKATIEVRPHWAQREEWRPDLYEAAKKQLLARDLSRFPGPDLLAVVELAERIDDPALELHAGSFLVQRRSEFQAAAQAGIYYLLGLRLQHRGDRGDQLAGQALQQALALSTGSVALHEKAKLRLVEFLLHAAGKPEEAAALLAPAPSALLTADERRLAGLLRGDLAAAQGKPDLARLEYAAREAKSAPGDELRRQAQLESAELLRQRGDLEAAEQVLDQNRREHPLDRLAPEVNLPLVQIYLIRKEYQRALVLCRELRQALGGQAHEAEWLLATVQAAFAVGQPDEAQDALKRLLREYPFSESAARAKDRWGSTR